VASLSDTLTVHVDRGSIPGAVGLLARGDRLEVAAVGQLSVGGFAADFGLPAVQALSGVQKDGREPRSFPPPDAWLASLAALPLLYQPGEAWPSATGSPATIATTPTGAWNSRTARTGSGAARPPSRSATAAWPGRPMTGSRSPGCCLSPYMIVASPDRSGPGWPQPL
jgi:hypothetical protein